LPKILQKSACKQKYTCTHTHGHARQITKANKKRRLKNPDTNFAESAEKNIYGNFAKINVILLFFLLLIFYQFFLVYFMLLLQFSNCLAVAAVAMQKEGQKTGGGTAAFLATPLLEEEMNF